MVAPAKNKGWTVTFSGTGINLALGILYTWSIFKGAIKGSIEKGGPGSFQWDLASLNHPYAICCLVFAFAMILAGKLPGRRAQPRIVSKITAVDAESYEESLGSTTGTTTTGNATLSSTNYNAVSWASVTGAGQYNVYRSLNGVFGFIGVAGSTSFNDIGAVTPDTTDTPPTARNPFSGSGNYPSCVTYYQQRLVLANTDNDTESCHCSRTGNFYNFTTSSPTQDDDAVTFQLAGRQVNEIHNVLDLGALLLFTETGERAVQGDSSGFLTPGQVNPKQYSYNGSKSGLAPLLVGGSAVYVQARGSIVRDLL